jgi:ankyrin repeat protein
MKNINNEVLQETLRRCESTGGWYGIKITSLNDRNHLGDTPLHTICSWGEIEPVKQLIAAGADINAKGDLGATPLFNAVIGENIEVVSLLLKSGADPKIKNDWNKTVLEYAKNTSAPKEIIKILGG